MPSDRTDADERTARIGVLLDELHLTAEDMTELAHQAVSRVRKTIEQSRVEIARTRLLRGSDEP